jgi:hypothetical protein
MKLQIIEDVLTDGSKTYNLKIFSGVIGGAHIMLPINAQHWLEAEVIVDETQRDLEKDLGVKFERLEMKKIQAGWGA